MAGCSSKMHRAMTPRPCHTHHSSIIGPSASDRQAACSETFFNHALALECQSAAVSCVSLSVEVHDGELDSREPLPFSFAFSLIRGIVCHSTLISSRALTLWCPSYEFYSGFFCLCPHSCPWLQQRQRRAFQVVFNKRRHASHVFAVPRIGPPYF